MGLKCRKWPTKKKIKYWSLHGLFINDVNTWSRLNFLLCQNCNLVHTTSNIESQARLNKVHDGDGEAGGGEGGEGGERRQ